MLDELEDKAMNKDKLLVCEHCGNIVRMVYDSGVPVMCCGEAMVPLKEEMAEEAPKGKHENYMVCNCNQVSYLDIVDALHAGKDMDSVLSAFESVKDTTRCSTGCGGCYDKVMTIISDVMMGHA